MSRHASRYREDEDALQRYPASEDSRKSVQISLEASEQVTTPAFRSTCPEAPLVAEVANALPFLWR